MSSIVGLKMAGGCRKVVEFLELSSSLNLSDCGGELGASPAEHFDVGDWAIH